MEQKTIRQNDEETIGQACDSFLVRTENHSIYWNQGYAKQENYEHNNWHRWHQSKSGNLIYVSVCYMFAC